MGPIVLNAKIMCALDVQMAILSQKENVKVSVLLDLQCKMETVLVILDFFTIIDVFDHALMDLLVKVGTVLLADSHAKHVWDLQFNAPIVNKASN